MFVVCIYRQLNFASSSFAFLVGTNTQNREVPWGEIVGSHSFDTWSKVYTGYGENGPAQGKLWNQGMTEEMKREFPDLDYITGCSVVESKFF